jgi:hypothetical protein
MSLYAIIVFLHIVGALGMFAVLGLEWTSVYHLRRAATGGQAREWAELLNSLRIFGGVAALTILATGIYLGATRWGHQGWIGVSFVGFLVIAALSVALTGRRAGAIVRVVVPDGSDAAALDGKLRDPVLLVSVWLRTTLALGIVFLMATKPSGPVALTVMGVALVLGLAAGLAAATVRARPAGEPAGAAGSR